MRFVFLIQKGWVLGLLMCVGSVSANEPFYLPLASGEEVTVHRFPATFSDPQKPLLIWFTEGYASRKPFKHLITGLNDEGYSIWQVDLLESYFIERTPTNIRRLSGEGVAAVMRYASEKAAPFVTVSSGRMSLILLRGARLWQLNQQPKKGMGHLQQVVAFFPNLYDAPKKAGDSPKLFPITSATSLPLTIIQPGEGTYKWKLPEVLAALDRHQSQVAVIGVPSVRDWYFIRRDPMPVEQMAGEQIVTFFETWLKAGRVDVQDRFEPLETLETVKVNQQMKGLVALSERTASPFTLNNIVGQSMALAEKKGKVVLLNFWASWCPPCVKEIPSMNRLAESFDQKRFEIVSVNFKESPETIAAFLKQVQVDFPVLMDADGKVSADYEIFAFPSSFLIDAQGKLQYSVNTAIEWDDEEVKKVVQSMIDPEL